MGTLILNWWMHLKKSGLTVGDGAARLLVKNSREQCTNYPMAGFVSVPYRMSVC
jgi:hypothetical protein